MTGRIKQWICIKFYIKLEHSSVETAGESEGHIYGLLVIGRFITITWLLIHHVSCNNFGQNIKWLRRLSPPTGQFGALWLLAFSQTRIISERKRLQTIHDIQENMMGKLMVLPSKDFAECFEQWKRFQENSLRSQCTYFEGDWGIILLCTMSIVSWIFFNKCLYFCYYMGGYFLERPCMCSLQLYLH